MAFPTDISDILDQIAAVDPVKYEKTRNYKNGAVSRLSPYISRGVISTRQVLMSLLDRDIPWEDAEKFVQELAWRDYWQQVWVSKKDEINEDLRSNQEPVSSWQVPKAIMDGTTGITAVDEAIAELKATGYMHNHMRMYVASIACNIGQAHWLECARWMYGLLLDGDWASNALSWQWVAGTNSSKKYYANQGNINKFFNSRQRNTFLDVSYDDLPRMAVPSALSDYAEVNFDLQFPETKPLAIDPNQDTLIYNYYNLDPEWHEYEDYNRVLLLDPQFFEAYPISQDCLDFALDLSYNIPGIQVFVGSFDELIKEVPVRNIVYKAHPTNEGYRGRRESRDWMTDVIGYFPSFFKFWNKAKKPLKRQFLSYAV
jgi:deoxyribodipyrimidine photo-lyase